MPDLFYVKTDRDEYVYFDGYSGEYEFAQMQAWGVKVFFFATVELARAHLVPDRWVKGTPSIYQLGSDVPVETYTPPPSED